MTSTALLCALALSLSSALICQSAYDGRPSPFYADNQAAMIRMMDAMAVKPTGDVDRDFVAMMIPHHQGAIDVATALLKYGHNPRLLRIAQEIVVEQQQEIIAMRMALDPEAHPSSRQP